jgi:hypothetical protein
MKWIKYYIEEHGIICWLYLRQQVRREYGKNARILYRNEHLTYFDFESAMIEWYNL